MSSISPPDLEIGPTAAGGGEILKVGLDFAAFQSGLQDELGVDVSVICREIDARELEASE